MARPSSRNFLDKYKHLNSWNKYYSTGHLNSSLGGSFERNDHLAHEVLTKAGPSFVYQKPGYHSNEVSNVTRVTTEVSHHPGSISTHHYKINEDCDPVKIVRPIEPVTQRQTVRIRHLEPPELPEPNPIIIKERQLTPPPPAPPILIRQRAPAPPTPPPLVIREKPPTPPCLPETTVIEKIIPPPSPPPRQVIIERIPAPEKPREIIYEKWLPYKPLAERPVIVERGRIYEKQPAPKNVIIEYENPKICIDRHVYDEGIFKADPCTYNSTVRHSGELRIVDKITELPLANSSYFPSSVSYTKKHSYSPQPTTLVHNSILTDANLRPKSSYSTTLPKGPQSYLGPWNTTYRTSYTGRGFGHRHQI